MASTELTDEQVKKLAEIFKAKKGDFEKNLSTLKHKFVQFNEGNFNNHEVAIIELQNKIGFKKYIVPINSQLSKRAQYYGINRIKDFLEDGLIQDRLVIKEDFQEMEIENNGIKEGYLVHRKLL